MCKGMCEYNVSSVCLVLQGGAVKAQSVGPSAVYTREQWSESCQWSESFQAPVAILRSLLIRCTAYARRIPSSH